MELKADKNSIDLRMYMIDLTYSYFKGVKIRDNGEISW